MAFFEEAYHIVKENEGDYVNDPSDSGGETYKGISRVYNPNWSGWTKIDEVKKTKTLNKGDFISDLELNKSVVSFYKQQQWDKIQGDSIPNQTFANFFVDFYVTSGGNAVKELQKILGITADGSFGSNSLQTLLDSDINSVYEKFYYARIEYYKNLPAKYNSFKDGWNCRVTGIGKCGMPGFPRKLPKEKELSDKIELSGDDTTKPDIAAKEKEKKENTIAKLKSEVKSKSIQGQKIKSAKQACPLQKGTKPISPKKNKPGNASKCNLSALSISKVKGTYVLHVKAVPNACTSGDLEIVAGYNKKKAKIKCSVTGIVGPCSTHKSKAIDFTDKFIQKTDTNLEFEAASKYAFSYFPWDPAINSYSFSANTCGSTIGSTVKVYPDTYWKLKVSTTFKENELDEIKIEGDFSEDQNSLSFSASSNGEISFDHSSDSSKTAFDMDDKGFKAAHKSGGITVGLGASDKKVESFYQNKNTKTESHTSFNDGGVKDISLQSGGDIKYKIDEQLKKNINGLFKAVKLVKFIQGLIKTIKKSDSPVGVEVKWPNIELEGNWQWKEIVSKPKCGFEYSIKGGLHPLIGSEVDVDLVGAVLLSIPGYGVLLNKILNSIEYITGDDLKVNLKLTGEVNCDVDVNKKAGDLKPTINSPKTHVDIILTLNASLKLKKHSFILGYGGGAEGSAKLIIDVNKPVIQNWGIDLPCTYQFTGITISSIEYKKESSKWSWGLPDEEDKIVEKKTEIGTWLTGEFHSFTLPLI